MKLHSIACVLLCGFSIFANATDFPVKKGASFLSARKELIQHGWKPDLKNKLEPGGLMKTLINDGISEVERCTDGVVYCKFNYKKNHICLGITTTGKKIKDMIVADWDYFTCSDTD